MAAVKETDYEKFAWRGNIPDSLNLDDYIKPLMFYQLDLCDGCSDLFEKIMDEYTSDRYNSAIRLSWAICNYISSCLIDECASGCEVERIYDARWIISGKAVFDSIRNGLGRC